MISREAKNAVATIVSHVLIHNEVAWLYKDAVCSPHGPRTVVFHLDVDSETLNVKATEKHQTTSDIHHAEKSLVDFITFLESTNYRHAKIHLETVTVDHTHEVV